MKIKTEITSSGEVIIIRFDVMNEKKMVKYQIKNVPKTKVKINNKFYRVQTALFHSGFDIKTGNFSAIVREGTLNWLSVKNEAIVKIQNSAM